MKKNIQPQLLNTTDFSRFVYHPNQQPISRNHVRKLCESMEQYGFLPSKPIEVCRDKDKFIVIDGHHRLEAARLLKIPAYYVEEPIENMNCIGGVNVAVRKWSGESFAKLYADKGNEDYLRLLAYRDLGIPLKCAASLLRGESAHSGNAGRLIQTGAFKIKNTETIDWIVNVLRETSDLCPEIKKNAYIEALSMCWFVEEFDRKSLISKIKNMPRGIVRAADRRQALSCIEEVYNFKRSIKINLVFLAQEKMKERNMTGLANR
jgi:hypothetical protein